MNSPTIGNRSGSTRHGSAVTRPILTKLPFIFSLEFHVLPNGLVRLHRLLQTLVMDNFYFF